MTMTDNHDNAVYETLPDLGDPPSFPVYEDMIYPGWEITVVEETDLDEEQPLIDPKMFPYRYKFQETTFVVKDTLPPPRVSSLIPSALSSSPENLSRR